MPVARIRSLRLPSIAYVALATLLLAPGFSRAEPESAAPATSSASDVPSFLHDVHPILQARCARCHLGPAHKGDYSMETRESALGGGESGPAIVPGDAEGSLLIRLVEDRADGMVMPMSGPRVPPEEIAVLRAWIDAGAPWEDASLSAAQKARPVAALAPRRVELPPASVSDTAGAPAATAPEPVDRILAAYWRERGLAPPEVVSDSRFARRAWYDVVGLPPSPEELEEFLLDAAPDKRARLVDRLLADSRGYAENWMSFWNDLLRNDFVGTGYIDGGREQITGWLYAALVANKPFDEFVAELLNPVPGSGGFTKGIVWRGTVNASQIPAMQASQNISQVFMGTNMKCASCHDSFVNQWKLKDAYGLAAIYSDTPLEIARCDEPTGEIAEMRFLYPELGSIDAAAPRGERLEQFARAMVRPENGRLARTIVNRVWARFLGRGLVEPLDDMDMPPWNADLLDWLAVDLVEHDWDLKHLMRRILVSRAYASQSVGASEAEEGEFVFRGPLVRRLSTEQFLDGLSMLTGEWRAAAAIDLDLDAPDAVTPKADVPLHLVRWIWTRPGAEVSAPAETVFFRRSFELPADWRAGGEPARRDRARVFLACDNEFRLFVNGREIGAGAEWNKPVAFDVEDALKPGRNLIAVAATNSLDGPAGLIAYARLRDGDRKLDVTSDRTWLASGIRFEGWETAGFFPLDWFEAAELGAPAVAPWNLAKTLRTSVEKALAGRPDRVRAWMTVADPVMRAMGRPNREQVVTRRASTATTIEAIELTNGETLMKSLESAAERLVAANPDPTELATRLYMQGVGRPIWPEELAVATSLVGSPATRDGVADLLWALTMLPEFQLLQ